MKAVLCEKYGAKQDGIYLADISPSICNANQVRVDVLFSPINPSDINIIEGNYYIQPDLPHVLGREGVGIISEIGANISNIQLGDYVISPFSEGREWHGFWCENFVVDAKDVIVLPKSIDLEQASMLNTNPLTAYQLIQGVVGLEKGDWVVQNAANSSVGRLVVKISRKLGFRTLNFVRRGEVVQEMLDSGADEVFVLEEGISKSKQIGRILKGAPVKLGLNAVGGTYASEVAKCLGSDGVLVTYGAMAKEPLVISNGQLIYKNLQFVGFNRTKWLRESSCKDIRDIYSILIDWLNEGDLVVPICKRYSLGEFNIAINLAMESSKNGKVLFDFSK